jgi:hypothetical protein
MKKYLILISSLIILITFFSCKKHIENKLEGDWREQNLVNVYSDTLIDWNFKDGSFNIIQTYRDSVVLDTLASGNYVIKDKFPLFRRILSITTCTDPTYKGDWRIMKLSSSFLTIALQTNDLNYYEFTKN